MSCWEGGSEVRHDAPNDSLSALPQSRLPAAACRAQWAYERASTLSLPGLRRLVRRDAGHTALPVAHPTRGDRPRPADRHAAGQPAGGRGDHRAQLRDDQPLAAPGRAPCRGAHAGASARSAPLHPRSRRILVLRPQKDGSGAASDPAPDGVASAVRAPAGAGEAEQAGPAGQRWGCLVIDRASRFVVAHASGPREEELAARVFAQTKQRSAGQALPWWSDGWRPYPEQVLRAYRQPVRTGRRGRPPLRLPDGVRLTQTIKHRDERGRLRRVETRATFGAPIQQPALVQGERRKGVWPDLPYAITPPNHPLCHNVTQSGSPPGLHGLQPDIAV